MTLTDMIILALAVLAVGIAVFVRVKNTKRGCCHGGKCAGCEQKSCSSCKPPQK